MSIVCVRAEGVRWRVFEHEMCRKYFGSIADVRPEDLTMHTVPDNRADFVLWKIHTEATSELVWKHCCEIAAALTNVKHINDPRNWLACHAKEKAFEIWQRNDVPCPRWFEFIDFDDLKRKNALNFPFLIRLNNGTGGHFSYLVNDWNTAHKCYYEMARHKNYCYNNSNNQGVGRKYIAVEYINAVRPEKINMSFRIIVAGNHVVTGYARLGSTSDWIAITNRFEPWMEGLFVKYQKVCQKFCEDNEPLIVKSVRCLGLNFQGVDVILDQEDKPYFLEVQPGFSVGYFGHPGWKPPYYNPSRPESLVNFLQTNEDRLRDEMPLYVNYWLNKSNMFDKAFKSLKEQLDGTGDNTTQ